MEELPVSEGLILAVLGALVGMYGAFLTCILRSRCTRINFCGLGCDRELPAEPPQAIEIARN